MQKIEDTKQMIREHRQKALNLKKPIRAIISNYYAIQLESNLLELSKIYKDGKVI